MINDCKTSANRGFMIYVLRTKNSTPSFLKVGYTSRDISKRIKGIQTGCPFELELLMLARGDSRNERGILNNLKEYRTQGEWFQDRPEVHEIIKKRFATYRAKPIDVNKIMTGKMTDCQKRVNRTFRSAGGFAFLLEDYCSQRRLKQDQIEALPFDKRAYVLSSMSWLDVSQKYHYLGPEFDGVQKIISDKNNKGENSKEMLKWLREHAPNGKDDIDHYEKALREFKEWQFRNKDFTTIL